MTKNNLRHTPCVIFFILLLATLLRFYHLSGQSLWADEGNSVALARRSFVEIAQRTAFDIHPPFYYWLLKIWITVFGDSEIGLRSLSAVLGVGLVYLIWRLGAKLFNRRVGLIAVFLAAFSPLQVYYAQETRMYMLLAVLSSLTVLATLWLWSAKNQGQSKLWSLVYVVTATAGFYTHYAYPLILTAVNLIALVQFWPFKWQIPKGHHVANGKLQIADYKYPKGTMWQIFKSRIIHWLILQLIPFLLYLPWLPTAWRQVTTWPSEKYSTSLYENINQIAVTLLFGLSWPFDLGWFPAIFLGLILLSAGLITLLVSRLKLNLEERQTNVSPLKYSTIQPSSVYLNYLWFLLPVTLTLVIFSPAFLKFLLVAAPALTLLLALLIESILRLPNTHYAIRFTFSLLLCLALSGAAALSLYHYFTNPAYARDNYRGMVKFITAVGAPNDAVILNAEGQQDVFSYYYERIPTSTPPVYPLPRRRPLDQAATLAELQAIAAQAGKIYAVYWATQQADPGGLIEGWLNAHLFKATDWWYGNVRLVSYASPQTNLSTKLTPVDYRLGEHIHLTGYALSTTPLTSGDILQLALTWQTDTPLTENYTVFVQILDPVNHLVGQRDAQPLMLASTWPVGEPVTDTHGIFIEPGTPPGRHRLIVGLYNSQTGQRLPVLGGTGDFVELTTVEIGRRTTPLPPEAFNIQTPLHTSLGEVTLLGYDLYKPGHRSQPDTPLHPGDPVDLTAYWQVNQSATKLTDQLLVNVVTNGGKSTPLSFTYPPAGVNYPIQEWPAGEIIRAQYDFFLSGLEPGTYRLRLTIAATNSSIPVEAVTSPFQVEP